MTAQAGESCIKSDEVNPVCRPHIGGVCNTPDNQYAVYTVILQRRLSEKCGTPCKKKIFFTYINKR